MSESLDACSLLSSSSQLDLMEEEVIDDKEFDIPQVDTPPTLESILNELEDEEEPFVLEDTWVMNTENIDARSCDSASLASSDSGDPAHFKRKKKAVELKAAVHGSVLRHSMLQGISAQIVSAADKVDAGLPTAITVAGVIVVGTSHGLALVFDNNQALRLCLGTKTTGAEFGAISALSINNDCSRLLCGFAKGQITMWDLANGKLLRTITDAHPPGTAILHVKFTDDPTLAVCSDSGGSVFELAFRRVMGMRSCDSRCLFSGSKGEVCCIEPLRACPDFSDHPITHYSLLALASLTKILVIGLKPSLKVWMTFPYSKSDPSSVPQLAWQFVSVQMAVNPFLAFCKGDTVHFLMIKREEMGAIHVIKQRHIHLSCDIISLNWINGRTLVLIDSHEKLQVVDRPSQEILEILDLEQVQLVYNSRHFKSLATGGNVSQALALVGEKACYQSISSYAGQIVCLGTKSAHSMTLRTWRERIDCLLKQEHFVEALSLAWSFHERTAKAVVGLCVDPFKRKGIVGDKMVEILFQFADHAMKRCPEQGRIQVMEQHFHDVIPILIDFCLLLQRTDLLFDQLYARLVENVVAKGVFLEALESYIVMDRLGHLPTPIMKDLLAHYHSNGLMDNLERCIVRLDVTSLDIQQVVQVCWANQLYDAMIYVFNSGMNDYITPMEKLFAVIGPPLREGRSLTAKEVVMGNKLLVYISCCLAGRAYPLGDIPEDLVVQVKIQVFEYLILLHAGESSSDAYPLIHTLLHFDTREFLNVLAMVSFPARIYLLDYFILFVLRYTAIMVAQVYDYCTAGVLKPNQATLGERRDLLSSANKPSREEIESGDSKVGSRIAGVEVSDVAKQLLSGGLARHLGQRSSPNKCFVDLEKAFDVSPWESFGGCFGSTSVTKPRKQVMVDNPDFTPSQVGGLFTFLARQLSKPDNTLFVNRKLFDQVLEFLCRSDDASRHTERQQVLLQLLQVGGVVQFDEEKLLTLSQRAKFYQILEFLYEKKHMYDKTIDCYLKDPLRKGEIFSYIDHLMSMSSHGSEEKQAIKNKTLQHIQELIIFDTNRSADLVVCHFAEEVDQIVCLLPDGELHFKFLSSFMESWERHYPGTSPPLEHDLHTHLLDLMCRFAPQQLLSFLQTSQHYKLEEAIQITEKYHHSEATGYLLEKKGDFYGAFTVLLEALKVQLSLLTADPTRGQNEEDKENESILLKRVENSLNDLIALGHRNSQKLQQPQIKELWFSLLETLMTPQKQVLKDLTMNVLNSMSSLVSLPAIIQQILQSPIYQKGQFAEIQVLILGMLDTFNYEQTLFETTTSLLNHDLHWSLAHLRTAVTRGLHPRQDYCNICLQQYKRWQDPSEQILLFSCGHLYHVQCLQQQNTDCGLGGASEQQQQQWSCYKCSTVHRGRGRQYTIPTRSRSTSLAQTRLSSARHDEAGRKKVFEEVMLDFPQEQSWNHLRCLYKGPSRLSVLTELSHCHSNERAGILIQAHPAQESFSLKLSPPPLLEE
ncbi:vacuolar protein sorting-associated protein 8 homolog [Hippocampus comes]|uniref:vacuolar protein sorting-associated protein 8 homolog n=1 Tax=Hippocampus comes TaxID=109280 RepID=UPI00094EF797|nr:PREDICTED: vacuolar protein sorting-associated protein 8 homolog [Hippocampus comes]